MLSSSSFFFSCVYVLLSVRSCSPHRHRACGFETYLVLYPNRTDYDNLAGLFLVHFDGAVERIPKNGDAFVTCTLNIYR